jgi:hypothetical protein
MSKTIELLERIGQDASLRHASQEHLAQALDALNASEGLKAAAASGDHSRLGDELGHTHRLMQANQNPNNGGCDPDEDDPGERPKRDGDHTD